MSWQLDCFTHTTVRQCQCARVKHSEFESLRTPDDSAASWPSPDQVYFKLGEQLNGTIRMPGDPQYRDGTYMKNLRFNFDSGAVVFPESTGDVQTAMLFAKENGIRPTVYSTGHDFLGRSARDHTLSINMRRMTQLEVSLSDPRSDTNMTMTLGTGVIWEDAYEEADKYGVIVLGGSSRTVSPGGYILGGGHSPITRTHGLGVDQVVAFTIVTENGTAIHVDPEGGTMEHPDGSVESLDDPDFWWAVLGGGGGVFGVVTQFVLKLHPAPDGFVNYVGQWPIALDGTNCTGVATETLEVMFDLLRTNLSTNWGGYILVSKDFEQTSQLGWVTFFLLHWGRDRSEAMENLAPLANFRRDCQNFGYSLVFDTFWEYEQQIDDTVWLRQHLIGTLLQEEDLVPGSGAAEMVTDMTNTTYLADVGIGCTGTLTGGNAVDLPQDATSASPDLRNGLVSLACGAAWYSEGRDEDIISRILLYGNTRMYNYGTGVYYNENDFYLQNWQVEQWGSEERYERLLGVKQRWDPDNVFWCHHCVGSEFV